MTNGLKVRTQVKAGRLTMNHSTAAGLRVRTSVKAGRLTMNHSTAAGLRVRTSVKGGGLNLDNHSEAPAGRIPESTKNNPIDIRV